MTRKAQVVMSALKYVFAFLLGAAVLYMIAQFIFNVTNWVDQLLW